MWSFMAASAAAILAMLSFISACMRIPGHGDSRSGGMSIRIPG
jgi:hypothetical protein